jgi:REP-associated tyrosine transposase
MKGWDYGRGGAYFVTICTQGRICCFGDIAEGQVIHSPLGQIVAEEWAPRPLGTIIGQFKGACTHRIWASDRRDFAWQPRFWDHVIRDEESLQRLRKYILENPLRWEEDRLHPNAPPTDETSRRRTV